MNFDLSDDQRQFVDLVARFLGPMDVALRRQLRAAPERYPVTRWSEVCDLGLLSLAAPDSAGGLGASRIDLALVAEALGRGLAIDPWLENGVLPVRLAVASGEEELTARLMAGETRAAFAFAEPGRRFALDARLRVENHALSGSKTLVLGGMSADLLFVTTADGLYLVNAGAEGVQRRGYAIVDGSEAAEIGFYRSSGRRLNLTHDDVMQVVGDARLLAAAEMVGLAQRLFDDTLDYVKQREQFGVAIASFQALQHRLVDCYAELELARSLMLRTALEPVADWPAATAGAKAAIGAAAMHIAREAVQLHGGMGQTDELAVGHAMKRVMLLDTLLGGEREGLLDYARAA